MNTWMLRAGAVGLAPVAFVATVAAFAVLGGRVGPSTPVVIAVGALAVAVLVRGSRFAITALLAVAVVGFDPVLVAVGPVAVVASDLILAVIVAWAVLRTDATPAGLRFLVPLGIFLAFVGLRAVASPDLDRSLVSWLRLCASFSLAWFIPRAMADRADVRTIWRGATFASWVSVGVAASEFVQAGGAPGRYGGFLAMNLAGLVSGFAVLSGAFGARYLSARQRLVSVAMGLTGLALTRSIGGITATGVALLLGAVLTARAQRGGRAGRSARVAIAAVVVGALAVSMVQGLRPGSLPFTDGFEGSSGAHRLVLGSAGWELFVRNPAVGVGWQRSSDPAVIGAPDIAIPLKERFTGYAPGLFPDQRASSVHNVYIHILAELGLVGMGLALIAAFAVWRRFRGRSSDPDVRFVLVIVALLLVWWNDNAFFSGQLEVLLMATCLGLGARLTVGTPAAEDSTDDPFIDRGPVLRHV